MITLNGQPVATPTTHPFTVSTSGTSFVDADTQHTTPEAAVEAGQALWSAVAEYDGRGMVIVTGPDGILWVSP